MATWPRPGCLHGLVERYCYGTHEVIQERHELHPRLGVCLPVQRWKVDMEPASR